MEQFLFFFFFQECCLSFNCCCYSLLLMSYRSLVSNNFFLDNINKISIGMLLMVLCKMNVLHPFTINKRFRLVSSYSHACPWVCVCVNEIWVSLAWLLLCSLYPLAEEIPWNSFQFSMPPCSIIQVLSYC